MDQINETMKIEIHEFKWFHSIYLWRDQQQHISKRWYEITITYPLKVTNKSHMCIKKQLRCNENELLNKLTI